MAMKTGGGTVPLKSRYVDFQPQRTEETGVLRVPSALSPVLPAKKDKGESWISACESGVEGARRTVRLLQRLDASAVVKSLLTARK